MNPLEDAAAFARGGEDALARETEHAGHGAVSFHEMIAFHEKHTDLGVIEECPVVALTLTRAQRVAENGRQSEHESAEGGKRPDAFAPPVVSVLEHRAEALSGVDPDRITRDERLTVDHRRLAHLPVALNDAVHCAGPGSSASRPSGEPGRSGAGIQGVGAASRTLNVSNE